MRRRDYRCPVDGLWEFVDSMHDQVFDHLPCPTCRRASKRQVAIPIIGKIDRGVFVTDFQTGPRGEQRTTLTRDEVERRLDYRPPDPFENHKPGWSADLVEKVMAKQDAGELPPPREVTPEQVKVLEKALKPT